MTHLKKLQKKWIIIYWSALLLVMTACIGMLIEPIVKTKANSLDLKVDSSHKHPSTSQTSQKSTSQAKRVTIRSVGDVLLHDTVYWYGQQADGSYNFDPLFKSVAPYLRAADITTANLETLVAGNQMGLSSYPLFNVPDQIVDSLMDMGVDIVSNATNHTMDFGSQGAHTSLAILKEKGLEYVGSYESWDDYNTPRVIEANGLKVGFLNYTYGTNGNPIPQDEPYLAPLLDEELIPLEIKRLKSFCDVTVVIFHYGQDSLLPDQTQIDWTQLAIDAGANFVLGGHSHIMQPMKRFNDHQGAWYSHGNFISGQVKEYEKVNGIAEYTFIKEQDQIRLESMRLMPIYNVGYPEWNHFELIPLVEAQDYGLWNGNALYEEIKTRFKDYEPTIEVVDYLEK